MDNFNVNEKLESEQINELSTALAKAQLEMMPAIHDKVNPHFKSSYASFNSINDASRCISAYGLSVTQQFLPKDGLILLITTLAHSSGQWRKSILPLTPCNTPQQMGSCITYLRRYSKAAILGISDTADDDANEATEGSTTKQAAVKPPQKEPEKPQQTSPKISNEDMERIFDLVQQFPKPQETTNRVLLAVKVDKMADMPSHRAKNAIEWLEKEIKKTQQTEQN